MKISSYNEWDTLREIVVGKADNANWPTATDPVFALEPEKTKWKETPVPVGPVAQHVIEESNEDLEVLCDILRAHDVIVHRPADMDFVKRQGMYNYCPRDRLLIYGDEVMDPAMMYPARDMEIEALADVVSSAKKVHRMPRSPGFSMDAANVCRLGDTWLYLVSDSGSEKSLEWLRGAFPQVTIEDVRLYSGVHIDSTIAPLCEGTVMVNADRVNKDNLPKAFKDWEIIWVTDDMVVPQNFYKYPYATKWIAINSLCINPSTVIVDSQQPAIIRELEKRNFTVIPHQLRHCRTLGGGFHCVTLDTWREA